jgi:transposase
MLLFLRRFCVLKESQFLLGTIRETPDMYLDELREILAITCGVNASPSTLWRTLHRAGFTMKKVSESWPVLISMY